MLGILAQHAGFPPGVLNVVHGPGERMREELCGNQNVGVVSYSGGEAGARKVGAACGLSGQKVPDRDLGQEYHSGARRRRF
jgi:acyl-CoA reductase-like NAD-dependent aldehyde dehydrogenase